MCDYIKNISVITFLIYKNITSYLISYFIVKIKFWYSLYAFCKSYQLFVLAFCNLSDLSEAKIWHTFSSQVIINFFYKDLIYYHTCFEKLVVNQKSKNKNKVT